MSKLSPESHKSTIARHFREANRYPRLERDEELMLARRWTEHRDEKAAEKILLSHLRYVAIIAAKYRHYQVPFSDLVSEGNLGLLTALEKYDPNQKTRFITYASFWIRARIVSFVLSNWSVAKSSGGVMRSKLFFALRRERARTHSEFGVGERADEALEERLGIKIGKLKRMLNRLEQHDVSLDQRLGPDREDSLLDVLPSEEASHDHALAHSQLTDNARDLIEKALEELDPREHFIATHRLMADREDELSLAEIGRRLGVTRERARQLETRAKNKLRLRIERLSRRAGTDPREMLAA